MSKKIILSTDPGIDDAIAIIFLSKINVLEAIWTTMGNNTLETCTNNTVKILELLGRRDIPIIEGAAKPLSRKMNFSAQVHGKDGLGNTELPLPDLSMFSWKKLDYIVSTITSNPNEVTIVSIGPLTNLANLIQNAPTEIINLVKEIIVMGGAVKVLGNVTPYAEFNIFCDPHAAKIVFNCDLPITLVGLDVTHKIILTETHLETLETKGTPATEFIGKIARFYAKFHRSIDGCYLHDPLAAAVAIDPTIVTQKELHIDVVTEDSKKIGKTYEVNATEGSRISVCLDVDAEKFFNLFYTGLLYF